MKLKAIYTEPEKEHYRTMCGFTDDERAVFDLRTAGKSLVQISTATGMSTTTLNRRLNAVLAKMQKVDAMTG